MTASIPMTFGAFVAPYADPRQSSSVSIQHYLRYVEAMDRLGYDQAWFGEHHSGGWENIPSPEIMIGAAVQRTQRITLGTGVVSLPYHHPLMVADRIVFLDHLTRGRINFGVGPGALPRDSEMMGMDYDTLRPRMEQSLQAILHLLDDDKPLDEVTEWYELKGAVLQQRSYTLPRVPITVAASMSPSGPRLAGRHGLELLSLGGTSQKSYDILGTTWEILEYEAAQHGQTVDRSTWKIVFQMHVAETYEQAVAQTRYGFRDFVDYRQAATPMRVVQPGEDVSHEELVERYIAQGQGLIGTPRMAIEFIEKMVEHTGGFGTTLLLQVPWANHEDSIRSLELIANEVMPHFDGRADARQAAYERLVRDNAEQTARILAGMQGAQERYDRERGVSRPEA